MRISFYTCCHNAVSPAHGTVRAASINKSDGLLFRLPNTPTLYSVRLARAVIRSPSNYHHCILRWPVRPMRLRWK